MDTVTCYSGSSYAERPQKFTWQQKEYSIESIFSTSLAPDRKRFHVRTDQEENFILDYIFENERWLIKSM
jgi:hypothetical protein